MLVFLFILFQEIKSLNSLDLINVTNQSYEIQLGDLFGVFINSYNFTSKNLSIFYNSPEEGNIVEKKVEPGVHYSFNGGTVIFQAVQDQIEVPFWRISKGHCSINNIAIIPHTMMKMNASQFSKFCIFSPTNLKSGLFRITLSNPLAISNFIIIESNGKTNKISKDSEQYQVSHPFLLVGRSTSAPIGTFQLSFSSLRPDDNKQLCSIQQIQNAIGTTSTIIPSYQCIDIEKPAFKLWIINLILIVIFIGLIFICNKRKCIDVIEFFDIKSLQPKPVQPPSIQEDLVIEDVEENLTHPKDDNPSTQL